MPEYDLNHDRDRRGFAYVTADTCELLDDMDGMVRCIEMAYRWQASGPDSFTSATPVALHLANPALGYTSHCKAVCLPELALAGVRSVGYRRNADGTRPRLGRMTRLVLLTDTTTGAPFALVDERYNYTLRTAGSVAAVADRLGPTGEPVLGIVGAGLVADASARMFDAVMPLSRILVTSRRSSSREAMVSRLAGRLDAAIEAVNGIDEVMRVADIVIFATTTTAPLVGWSQVRPGTLLCALGSNELDDEIYGRADKVLVDDWEQTRTKADIKPMLEAGTMSRERLHGELGDVVTNKVPGRESQDEIIVIRTEGLASQDVALAYWSYLQARERGMVHWIIAPDDDPAGVLED
jgi:ornithine cyclodeaminase/alanine dehydrogenase-like protein (mu-crystallin family)